MDNDKILEIYVAAINKPEFNEQLQHNSFDVSWLKPKLDQNDYYKLEEIIFDYGNYNDELLFKAAFQYAWDLFLQCNYNK